MIWVRLEKAQSQLFGLPPNRQDCAEKALRKGFAVECHGDLRVRSREDESGTEHGDQSPSCSRYKRSTMRWESLALALFSQALQAGLKAKPEPYLCGAQTRTAIAIVSALRLRSLA